ncbi:MAG: DUF924 domain-containing protein [Gammaproteobacteria bacterium]|nr:DUF924 domain-containing protein [Gammaproteobacteria bacterium]
MPQHPWAELISTWFAETLDDDSAVPARMKWWFSADKGRDAELAARFSGLVEQCAQGKMYRWLEEPEGRLALILALDQLPRNLFRGTPRAFAYDSHGAALCLAAAHTGEDRELKPVQRAFLYMPLQHFEDPQAQNAGVALYQQLAEENPGRPIFAEGFLSYARQHRDIIARFGRFPHRNKILGRKNTAGEAEYLTRGAPTFGQ